ncbi:ATP-grasp domain-containing protein [Methylobacterium sp. E-045]|uniref:ATP-grasp domain-containing protein n=1 Tax=Methylobacterium sp. E-045 TaxID=2836575 RepID=UPI001FBA7F25|nr:ATP-grasp domain-containing protein [Methylobacterium sp. E-045]MCJ2128458.1 ATP-grasp domain-containing protein [Methylobacterium sp. E-045]
MTNPVTWLCDVRLTQYRRNIGQPTIEEACRELGYPVHVVDFDPKHPSQVPEVKDAPVVAYGTHQFVRAVTKAQPHLIPGPYARYEKLGYMATAGNLGDLMLNDDFILLPYGEVLRRGCDGLGEAFFLKPEAVTKAFTGFVMTRETWDAEVETIHQKSALPVDALCVVAKPREIEGEFRFVIVDGAVVTGSQYRWNDRLDVRMDVLPICQEMAVRVTRNPWQPDRVSVCDIALLEGRTKAKVVELNSFSTSGLYACDTRAIVKAVSRSAQREYDGEDEIA